MAFGIGIVGAGSIAQVHAQGIVDAGGSVVGFCDVDFEKAKAAAATHGGMAWSSSDEMFANEAVTAVVIAVPNVFHAPLAIAALEAGNDVLLEKPMAMNENECQAVLDARDRSGRTLQVGFVCRFAATVAAAKRHIAAGDSAMSTRRGQSCCGDVVFLASDDGLPIANFLVVAS